MLRGIVATATAMTVTSAVLAAPSRSGADAPQPDADRAVRTLTIYSSLPFQGFFRPQSLDMVRAMRMALADRGGRVNGHPIRFVSLEGASPETGFPDPDAVIENARRAAGDPTTIAYLGEFNSFVSALSIPILNEAGVLQVSPSNTDVGLTRADGAAEGEPDVYYPTGRRTYGRVVPANHLQAAAVVAYLMDKACPDVYIVNDRGGFGRGVAHLVQEYAVARGLTVRANEGIRPSTPKVRAAAKRVAASGAGCFFFGGVSSSNAPLLFKSVGAKSPGILLFGPDGVAESDFTERLGTELQKRVFLTNPTLSRKSYPALGQDFFADFKKRFGHFPEPYAIYAYEAMSVVLKSIADARRTRAGCRAEQW